MKVLVTGGSGFIGTHLQYYLGSSNIFKVRIYDKVYNDDLRDRANLDREIESYKPDAIVHLGALAGVRRGEDYPKEYFDTNVWGTENVFSLAKKHNVSKVISFSSSSVFNDKGEHKPQSHYGRTKYLAEQIAEMYKDEIPNVYIVRPFTVYGKNGRGDQVIYKWINQIKTQNKITFYGDGNSYRPYTHVEDLCEAVENMLIKNLGFQVFNIGGKEKIYLKDLLEIFQINVKKDFTIEMLPMPKADSMGREPSRINWEMINYEPRKIFKDEVENILEDNFGTSYEN